MPLREEDIGSIAARFSSRRHIFEGAASEVHRRIVNLLHERGLKSVVTSRAKSAESLKRTLWRKREAPEVENIPEELSPPLFDLAGVRVLLYREEDIEPTLSALRESFDVVQDKPKRSEVAYSAHHFVVNNWCDTEHAELGKHRGVLCEVQVCTILEHVWNELEHDIIYKQPGGKPDLGQQEMLTSLRAELDLCAKTSLRLIERTNKRRVENDQQILGPDALRNYFEDRLPGKKPLAGAFDQLWDLLTKHIQKVTPQKLDEILERGRKEDRAEKMIQTLDPHGALYEVGLITLMILPTLPTTEVRDIIGEAPKSPLWRFILSALNIENQP